MHKNKHNLNSIIYLFVLFSKHMWIPQDCRLDRYITQNAKELSSTIVSKDS